MRIKHIRFPARGSALISTLLLIVVLTIIVTAFMQSMAIERQTARSYLNRYKAELAAESGIAEVLGLLKSKLANSQYHYSIGYENLDSEQEALRIHLRSTGSSAASETMDLVSSPTNNETVRIKIAADSTVTGGFLVRQAGWKDLEARATDSDEVVGRYAFWTDAASSKQDVAVVSRTTTRKTLESLAEIPMHSRFGDDISETASTKLPAIQDLAKAPELLPTPKTVNQLVDDIQPLIDDYDLALGSRTTLLTPEGKPRLNLTRLKRYIDGGTYIEYNLEGEEVFREDDIPPLPLDQGPASDRFLLITQLLNEDGNYPATKENDWGYGNLEILKKIFPAKDVNENYTQARQVVANLIDYIDSDIIPTTDGTPGDAPLGGNLSGSSFPSPNHILNPAPPSPTVLGVEARYEAFEPNGAKAVRGHPYIMYAGQGFIFNSGKNAINSTRVVGWVGMGYPWEQDARIAIGSDTRYQVEMQIALGGIVTGGTRGSDVQNVPPTPASQGYFLKSWLAQESGYFNGDAVRTSKFAARSYKLFPRDYHGSFDLGNGYYTINQPNVVFQNMTASPEVLRLVYYLNGSRYLLQDLSFLKNKQPRPWSPANFQKTTSQYKAGSGWTQQDWHYQGDPRMSFREDKWSLGTTTGTNSTTGFAPGSGDDIYSSETNARKDPQQDIDSRASFWPRSTATKNHFPTYSQGYEPSKGSNEPAMRSFSELGFIHAGAPWQTLTLYNDPARFASPFDTADWRLLDYVDLGILPRSYNSADQVQITGLMNVNTSKNATLKALLADIDDLEDPTSLISLLRESKLRPFLDPSNIVDESEFVGAGSTDFGKEKLLGKVFSALTSTTQTFTIYSMGEARSEDRTLARATLVADVELRPVVNEGITTLEPIVLRKYQK